MSAPNLEPWPSESPSSRGVLAGLAAVMERQAAALSAGAAAIDDRRDVCRALGVPEDAEIGEIVEAIRDGIGPGLVVAAVNAFRLIDSVAFVAVEGDSAAVLAMLRRYLTRSGMVL